MNRKPILIAGVVLALVVAYLVVWPSALEAIQAGAMSIHRPPVHGGR